MREARVPAAACLGPPRRHLVCWLAGPRGRSTKPAASVGLAGDGDVLGGIEATEAKAISRRESLQMSEPAQEGQLRPHAGREGASHRLCGATDQRKPTGLK